MPFPVKLQVYDVSNGIARQISLMLLGRQLEGLWHTAISVHGNEYFFGGNGIAFCPPAGTVLGPPTEVVDLGETEIDQETFHEYLESLAINAFFPESYHVLDHNCNTFSAEVALFLTSRTIPAKITNLSSDVMNTPFGQMIRPFIVSMQGPVQSSVGLDYIGQHHPNSSPSTTIQSGTPSESNSTKQTSKVASNPAPPASSSNASKNASNPKKSDNAKKNEDHLDLD